MTTFFLSLSPYCSPQPLILTIAHLTSVRSVLPLDPHMDQILWYLSSWAYRISVSLMILGLSMMLQTTIFHLLCLRNIQLYTCTVSLVIHLSKQHPGCFRVFPTENIMSISTGEQRSIPHTVYLPWKYTRKWFAGSHSFSNLGFVVFRKFHILSYTTVVLT